MDELRAKALNEAADFAEFYANERMRLAQDAILHDPVLSGRRRDAAALLVSRDMQIDGTINSAAYHAAMDLAGHLRRMATEDPDA